jgi:spermidine/putrescine-binding protein
MEEAIMDSWRKALSRRRFLQTSAGVTGAAVLGGMASASRVLAQSPATGPTGTFNWLTWGDHWYQEQLDEIGQTAGILTSPELFSDNVEAWTKISEGSQIDMVSGDALWVPKYYTDGLIEAWDINELKVSQNLFPIAREFEIWTTPEGYLGFPFGWSPIAIYYDPAHVTGTADSWELLLDPHYAGRVVVEDQPVEVTAYMGKLAGAVDPYNMTPDELAKVKDLLTQLKPNILRFAPQATDTYQALASGEAWIGTGNLGTDLRVKELGGPELAILNPKEGTVGWMDAEMIVKGGANTQLIKPFLELAEQPAYIAENFHRNPRPLFNEGAYKLLVNNGQQELADRYLFNKPETVLEMTLKGPGTTASSTPPIWVEVFGA